MLVNLTKNNLDPRTKVLFLIPANIALFMYINYWKEGILIAFFAVIIAYFITPLKALRYIIMFAVMLTIELFILNQLTGFLWTVCYFIGVTSRKLLPCLMAGNIFFSTTTPNEMIVALRKLKVPQYFVIPFAVLMRYFPTIKQDFISLRQAMKMRGIASDIKTMILHPLQTFEYLLVPFLLSGIKTADELSAAAISRGIANPQPHTSLQEIKFGKKDYFYQVVIIIITYCLC